MPITSPYLGLLNSTNHCNCLLRRTRRPILARRGKNARPPWLPPSSCFHRHPWPVSSRLWTLSAEGLVCCPARPEEPPGSFPNGSQGSRSHALIPQARFPQGSQKLLQIPYLQHILKRQGGGDTGPSRGRSRGQTCRIKEKKQSFPGGGRQRPRLLEADRNDQRTRMDGRGGGKEQPGDAGRAAVGGRGFGVRQTRTQGPGWVS